MQGDASIEQTEIKGRIDWQGVSDHDITLIPVNQQSPPSKDVWSHLRLSGRFPLKIAHL